MSNGENRRGRFEFACGGLLILGLLACGFGRNMGTVPARCVLQCDGMFTVGSPVAQRHRSRIKKQANLAPVVEALELEKRWSLSRADAVDKIRSKLEARIIDDGNWIEIVYRDAEPSMAVEIVGAIAKSYCDRVLADDVLQAEKIVESLERHVVEHRAKVEASRAMFNALETKLGNAGPALSRAGTDVGDVAPIEQTQGELNAAIEVTKGSLKLIAEAKRAWELDTEAFERMQKMIENEKAFRAAPVPRITIYEPAALVP